MSRAIGIDLGTTYSAMAVVGDDGAPRVIDNAEGEATTPSVVLFQDIDGKDSPMVGSMAKHMAASQPMDVVQFVKRHMGDPNWRFDSANYTYTPEEVSALILKRLKQDAEQALGGSIDDAVITVPAYFDDARRTSTKQAGQIAGFNVLRVLNEPTAAAISYGLDHDRDGVILVYDLGGGTFDVTALRVNGNDYEVLATDGNRNLGGFDFDNALMQIVADDVAAQGGEGLLADPVAAADLREKAEMAKRALSNVPQTSVYVTFQGNNYRVRVTRQAFEDATQSLINQTRDTVLDVSASAPAPAPAATAAKPKKTRGTRFGAKWKARTDAAKAAASYTRRISFVSLAVALCTSLSYYLLFPVFVCMGRRLPMTMDNFGQMYQLLSGQHFLLFGASLITLLVFQLAFAMCYLGVIYIPDFDFRIICAALGITMAGYTVYVAVTLNHEFFLRLTPYIDGGLYYLDSIVSGVALLAAAFAAKLAENRGNNIGRIALWALEGLLVIVAIGACFY